jgi:hypothetical protein
LKSKSSTLAFSSPLNTLWTFESTARSTNKPSFQHKKCQNSLPTISSRTSFFLTSSWAKFTPSSFRTKANLELTNVCQPHSLILASATNPTSGASSTQASSKNKTSLAFSTQNAHFKASSSTMSGKKTSPVSQALSPGKSITSTTTKSLMSSCPICIC